MKRMTLVLISVFVFIVHVCGQDESDWRYLGMKRPGKFPVVFAPDIVSTRMHEHSSPTFSRDMKKIYWSVFTSLEPAALKQEIYHVRYERGAWTKPAPAPFSGKYSDGGPFFSPDGNKLFFYSERPKPGSDESVNDLYYMLKTDNGFSKPYALGFSSLSTKEKWIFAPSLTQDGVLYVTGTYGTTRDTHLGIFSSRPTTSGYETPTPLGLEINGFSDYNWTSFVAPDALYIIISSKRRENRGYNDLYISFDIGGKWTSPMNMGDSINNGHQVRFPSVSPDGKYLFFTRRNGSNMDDIFWMDASVIHELHEKAIKGKGRSQ